jgi:hypothetical protein
MTHYLLSVHNADASPYASEEEAQASFAATGVFNEELMKAGQFVFAGGLEFSSTAKVVRVKDGALQQTDGPYLEAKEHIGGFWVIDVPDEATALDLARRATVACGGAVEVRPFQGIDAR